MALNVKQQIKKQGFETSQRKKKTERRYNTLVSSPKTRPEQPLKTEKNYWLDEQRTLYISNLD